jgi:mRNA (guanine-N7-)-methyltransferase
LSDIREKIVFDIVSTQFAIHYMFESEIKLRSFLRNVSDRLEPGGFFIGTTIDSDELVFRVRSSGSNNNKISNDFMTVILPQDTFSKS